MRFTHNTLDGAAYQPQNSAGLPQDFEVIIYLLFGVP